MDDATVAGLKNKPSEFRANESEVRDGVSVSRSFSLFLSLSSSVSRARPSSIIRRLARAKRRNKLAKEPDGISIPLELDYAFYLSLSFSLCRSVLKRDHVKDDRLTGSATRKIDSTD